jgi:hypothetical protein
VRVMAAASAALQAALAGPPRPAGWLGASASALYLRTAGWPGVLAVLTHDAVRLPCGVLLPRTSGEMPLGGLAPAQPADALYTVGNGAVSWTGPAGPVEIVQVRQWAPACVSAGAVEPAVLDRVLAVLPAAASAGLYGTQLGELSDGDPASVVPRLVGRGPGLTPSGDDVLAGFLIGARAFGLDVAVLRRAALRSAPAATTALSAALLWHAARGECIDEVVGLAAALQGRGAPEPALSGLLAVGHTSGAALALGLIAAAHRGLRLATANADKSSATAVDG